MPVTLTDAATAAQRRQAENRREMRSIIIAAAERQLSEVGPARFSLRAVARDIGYSPAALYEYFPSKELLLETVYFGGTGGVRDRLVQSIRQCEPGTPFSRLFRQLAYAYREAALEKSELFRFAFGRLSVRPGQTADPSTRSFAVGLEADVIALLRGQHPRSGELDIQRMTGFDVFLMVIGSGYRSGALRGEPAVVAMNALSGVHGFVTMELAGVAGLLVDFENTLTGAKPGHRLDEASLRAARDAWFDGLVSRLLEGLLASPYDLAGSATPS